MTSPLDLLDFPSGFCRGYHCLIPDEGTSYENKLMYLVNIPVHIVDNLNRFWRYTIDKTSDTLSGISTLPNKSWLIFPVEAFNVSLMNFLNPRLSLISLTFLSFSETFSSGLKSLKIEMTRMVFCFKMFRNCFGNNKDHF